MKFFTICDVQAENKKETWLIGQESFLQIYDLEWIKHDMIPIIFDRKKKWSVDTQYNTDEPWKHDVKKKGQT